MADHKIGFHYASHNNQSPDRIWLTTTESGNVDDWTQWLDDQDQLHPKAPRTEYIRADMMPKWQPIETAPRDGFFLVCEHPGIALSEFDVSVSVVWMGRDGVSLNAYLDADGIEMPYLDGSATHWMPLPPPPSEA